MQCTLFAIKDRTGATPPAETWDAALETVEGVAAAMGVSLQVWEHPSARYMTWPPADGVGLITLCNKEVSPVASMPHLILHCAPDRFGIFSDDLGLNWHVAPGSHLPESTWLRLMGPVRAETGQGTQRFLHLLEGSATPATTGLLRALEILERELEKVLEDKVALARQLEESERTRHSAEDALALAAARIEALEAELEAIRAARRSEPDESLFRRLAGLAGAALIAASTLSAGVAGGFDIYTHLTNTPAAATAQLKPAAPALSNVIGQAQIVIEQCQVGDPPRP